MRSVVRTLTASTLAGATIVAATGWLYAVHGRVHGWPGPGVRDALALDELPHRSGVPLALYLLVWGTAALLLALLARWARADALVGGLLVGVAVGGWLYALNGVSILVVRQISAHSAFHGAAGDRRPDAGRKVRATTDMRSTWKEALQGSTGVNTACVVQ